MVADHVEMEEETDAHAHVTVDAHMPVRMDQRKRTAPERLIPKSPLILASLRGQGGFPYPLLRNTSRLVVRSEAGFPDFRDQG